MSLVRPLRPACCCGCGSGVQGQGAGVVDSSSETGDDAANGLGTASRQSRLRVPGPAPRRVPTQPHRWGEVGPGMPASPCHRVSSSFLPCQYSRVEYLPVKVIFHVLVKILLAMWNFLFVVKCIFIFIHDLAIRDCFIYFYCFCLVGKSGVKTGSCSIHRPKVA